MGEIPGFGRGGPRAWTPKLQGDFSMCCSVRECHSQSMGPWHFFPASLGLPAGQEGRRDSWADHNGKEKKSFWGLFYIYCENKINISLSQEQKIFIHAPSPPNEAGFLGGKPNSHGWDSVKQPPRAGYRQRAPKPWLQVGLSWDRSCSVPLLCAPHSSPSLSFTLQRPRAAWEGGFVTWTPQPMLVLAFPRKIPSLLTSSCAQFFLPPSLSKFSNSQMPKCLVRSAQPHHCGCPWWLCPTKQHLNP